jgi:carbohydrate-selective porin OprB
MPSRATTGSLGRPNIQYILHPNGTTAYENVVVIGLKTTLDF